MQTKSMMLPSLFVWDSTPAEICCNKSGSFEGGAGPGESLLVGERGGSSGGGQLGIPSSVHVKQQFNQANGQAHIIYKILNLG